MFDLKKSSLCSVFSFGCSIALAPGLKVCSIYARVSSLPKDATLAKDVPSKKLGFTRLSTVKFEAVSSLVDLLFVTGYFSFGHIIDLSSPLS